MRAMELARIVQGLAQAWQSADARGPVHPKYGDKGPGIGPYDEESLLDLLLQELASIDPELRARARTGVKYPSGQESDLCIADSTTWEWVIEIKLARMKRAYGGPEPAALARILSPYDESAIVDCEKILKFPAARRGIIVIGYEYDEYPLEPLIVSFEVLARAKVDIGMRFAACFRDNQHPYHNRGCIFGWEIRALNSQ